MSPSSASPSSSSASRTYSARAKRSQSDSPASSRSCARHGGLTGRAAPPHVRRTAAARQQALCVLISSRVNGRLGLGLGYTDLHGGGRRAARLAHEEGVARLERNEFV